MAPLAIGFAAVALSALVLSATLQRPIVGASPAGPELEPIESALKAEALSRDRLPEHATEAEIASGLTTLAEAEIWLGVNAGVARSATGSDTPVWVVGIRTQPLEVHQVVDVPGVVAEDRRQVAGAFYVWDATTGFTLSEGALLGPDDLNEIRRLPTPLAPVTRATLHPPLPTVDPAVFEGKEAGS